MRQLSLPQFSLSVSVITVIIGAFLLTSSGSVRPPYSSIYTIKLDFTDTNFTKVIPSDQFQYEVANLTIDNSGLSDVYIVGLKQYCTATRRFNGGFHVRRCTSASRNTYFDPYSLIANQIRSSNRDNTLSTLDRDDIKFPKGLPNFQKRGGLSVDKIFITILIGVIFSGVSLSINFLALCFPQFESLISWLIVFCNFITVICLIIGASIATQMYDKTVKSFQNGYEEFGIDATKGNNRFYILVWVITAIQLLFLIFLLGSAIFKNRYVTYKEGNAHKDSGTGFLETRAPFRSRFDNDSDAEAGGVIQRYSTADVQHQIGNREFNQYAQKTW